MINTVVHRIWMNALANPVLYISEQVVVHCERKGIGIIVNQ